MTKLRVPTIQHLARNYRDDPERICNDLVRLAVRPPNFSYDLLFRLARDMLVFGQPYDEIVTAVCKIPRKDLQPKFLEILPLLRAHFEGEKPDYFQDIAPRLYSAGRGLMVPFAPPFIYGVGGQIYFPWISFWRTNPLADERLSLFVTVVESLLLDDPDLETARFQIVDFSAPAAKAERELRVIDAAEIPKLSDERLRDMLATYAEGFSKAQKILAAMPPRPPRDGKDKPVDRDPDQDDMFRKDDDTDA